jgi:hypothetical protein
MMNLTQPERKTGEVIIFCGSYPQIENTLHVAGLNKDKRLTIVVPGNADLHKFLLLLNERAFHGKLNIVFFEHYQGKRVSAKGINKAWHVIPDIIRERKYLREVYNTYFCGKEGAAIYFFGRAFDNYIFYFIRQLSKSNEIIYIPDPSYTTLKITLYRPWRPLDLSSLLIMKMIYGSDIAMGQISYLCGFTYMTDDFMKRRRIRTIHIDSRNEFTGKIDIARTLGINNYEVIYYDHNLIDEGLVLDRVVLKEEMGKIFQVLKKHFPESRIARKYHPGYPADKTLIEVGDILPDFIPGELFYSDNVKVYLSFFSTALANVEKGTAISLADLITFRSEEIKRKLKETLIQRSKSTITFPKSLQELEDILKSLRKN